MGRRAWLVSAVVAACGGGGGGGAEPDADEPDPPDAAVDGPRCSPEVCDGCCVSDQCFAADSPACDVDRCDGIGPQGVCTSPTEVTRCLGAGDEGTPAPRPQACRAGEMCQETSAGAGCVLVAACRDGETRCRDAATPQTCTAGQWQSAPCATSCVASSLGARCAAAGPTRVLAGTLQYQRRGIFSSPPTDWSALTVTPAAGFEVVAARVSPGGTQVFDATVTDAFGSFAVEVPTAATALDQLLFVAAATGTAPDSGALVIAYTVADPGLPPGPTPRPLGEAVAPRPWTWSTPVAAFAGTHVITGAAFSGAAHLFHNARHAASSLAARFGPVPPFAIWVAPGINWSCGTCHFAVPATWFATTFTQQIFFRSDSGDEPYWSDSVALHELGHVAMAAFGRAVGEGGRHCSGVATAPGLAWSEGYATWFSSDLRRDPLHVDKQGGSMVWFDIERRTSSVGAWPLPISSAGLGQDLYQNEVAGMLWALTSIGGHGLGNIPIDVALTSPRLTIPPFERDYTRQTWMVSPTCARVGVVDTGTSTTHFADLLDALVCGGTLRELVDDVTRPSIRYPYPSSVPRCRR